MSWGDTWLLIGILSPLLLPATVACVFVLFYITIELDRWLRKASGGSEDPSAHPPAPAISAPSNLEPMELGRSESAPVFVLQEGAPENNLGGHSVLHALRFLRQAQAEKGSRQRKRIDALPTWRLESADPEDGTCAVCLEPQSVGLDVRALPCRHVFCKACIDAWLLLGNATCPDCRAAAFPRHKKGPSRAERSAAI